MPDDDAQVTVSLTRDEALVLFDLLHRWEDGDQVGPPEHHGEQVALWGLSASLEKVLGEPFAAAYADLVSQARLRLSASG